MTAPDPLSEMTLKHKESYRGPKGTIDDSLRLTMWQNPVGNIYSVTDDFGSDHTVSLLTTHGWIQLIELSAGSNTLAAHEASLRTWLQIQAPPENEQSEEDQ